MSSLQFLAMFCPCPLLDMRHPARKAMAIVNALGTSGEDVSLDWTISNSARKENRRSLQSLS